MSFDTATINLTRIECCKCHCVFAISSELQHQLQENHDSFYCPFGHSQSYIVESARERAEKAAARAQELLAQERQRAATLGDRIQAKERQLIAKRGYVTKLKNRITEGKCPCCSEKFPNLSAHMRAAHPTYSER